MNIPKNQSLASLFWAWIFGIVCGLGMASTVVGLLRGEPVPGVLWPAMTPLLLVPFLVLLVLRRRDSVAKGSSGA